MAYSEEQLAAVRAKLALGEKPRAIAESTGVKYQTVLAIKKRTKPDADKVSDLMEIDPVALDVIVTKAKEEAPAKVVKQLEKVQEGLSGLQALDAKFHTTMALALGKAEDYLTKEDLKPSEWVSITNALSQAYSNIFNNKGVNVNVNNGTQFSDSKLSMFKGSLRS